MTNKEKLCGVLVYIRTNILCITQKEICKKLNTEQSNYSRAEKGLCSERHYYKMFRKLNITVKEIDETEEFKRFISNRELTQLKDSIMKSTKKIVSSDLKEVELQLLYNYLQLLETKC